MSKRRCKGVVPDCHLNTLEALIFLDSAAGQLNFPGLYFSVKKEMVEQTVPLVGVGFEGS